MAKAKTPKKSIEKSNVPLTGTSLPSFDAMVKPVAEAAFTVEAPKTNTLKADPLTTPVAPVSASPESAHREAVKPEAAASAPTKTETRKTLGRPEIVKSEPRANIVPINVEEEIRRLAYIFSERRGFEAGHETEDWLNAEREIRQRYHQQSA